MAKYKELEGIELEIRQKDIKKLVLELDEALKKYEEEHPAQAAAYFSKGSGIKKTKTIKELEDKVRKDIGPMTHQDLNILKEEALIRGGINAHKAELEGDTDSRDYRVSAFVAIEKGITIDVSGKEFTGLNLEKFPFDRVSFSDGKVQGFTFTKCKFKLPDDINLAQFMTAEFYACEGMDQKQLDEVRHAFGKQNSGKNKRKAYLIDNRMIDPDRSTRLSYDDYRIDQKSFVKAIEPGTNDYIEILGHLKENLKDKGGRPIQDESFKILFGRYDGKSNFIIGGLAEKFSVTEVEGDTEAKKVIEYLLSRYNSNGLHSAIRNSVNLGGQEKQSDVVRTAIEQLNEFKKLNTKGPDEKEVTGRK